MSEAIWVRVHGWYLLIFSWLSYVLKVTNQLFLTAQVFTLDDALEYVNQHNSENQTYSQFATDTQQFQTSLSGENSSFTVTTFPDPPQQDKQIEETCLVNQSQNYSDYSQFNQSDQVSIVLFY